MFHVYGQNKNKGPLIKLLFKFILSFGKHDIPVIVGHLGNDGLNTQTFITYRVSSVRTSYQVPWYRMHVVLSLFQAAKFHDC